MGQVDLYISLESAVRALGPWAFHSGRVARRPMTTPSGGWATTPVFLPQVYQVYSDGVFLPANEAMRYLPPHPPIRYSWRRTESVLPPFRRGVIPGTANRPAGGRMFRRPGTLGLLRIASIRRDEDEFGFPIPPVRARLGRHPTAWDDLTVSSDRSRSWKRHRGHQWRPPR